MLINMKLWLYSFRFIKAGSKHTFVAHTIQSDSSHFTDTEETGIQTREIIKPDTQKIELGNI